VRIELARLRIESARLRIEFAAPQTLSARVREASRAQPPRRGVQPGMSGPQPHPWCERFCPRPVRQRLDAGARTRPQARLGLQNHKPASKAA